MAVATTGMYHDWYVTMHTAMFCFLAAGFVLPHAAVAAYHELQQMSLCCMASCMYVSLALCLVSVNSDPQLSVLQPSLKPL